MKRKRTAVVLLALIIMTGCLLMTGCGAGSESASDSGGQLSTEEAAKADSKQESVKNEQKTEQAERTDEAAEQTASDTQEPAQENKTEPAQANRTKSAQETKTKPAQEAKTKPAQETKTKPAADVCYVTVDGYCSGKPVEISSSDNAYTVLRKSGATVNARKSQYGIYVVGINGLNEFDKGDESGWMYSVNGKEPSSSADSTKVGNGDKVRWYYVTGY